MAYLQSAASTADLSTYTFSSQSFGTTDPDRYIVVAITSRMSGTVANTVTGVTIGGVTASELKQSYFSASSTTNTIAWYAAPVPTGASGDVVVTFANGQLRCVIHLYNEVLKDGLLYDFDIVGNSTAALTLNVPENGVALAAASIGISTTTTWSGATENYDAVTESFFTSTAAYHTATAAEPDHSINATFATHTAPYGKIAISLATPSTPDDPPPPPITVVGYDTVSGATEFTSGSGGAGRCMKAPDTFSGKPILYAAVAGDKLTKFSVYTRDSGSSSTEVVGVALYEVVDGIPVTRAHPEVTITPTNTSAAWVDSAALSYDLTEGVTYAIAIRTEGSTSYFSTTSGVPANNVSRDNRTGPLNDTYVEDATSTAIYLVTYEVTHSTDSMSSSIESTFSESATLTAVGALASVIAGVFSFTAILLAADAAASSISVEFSHVSNLTAVGELASDAQLDFSDNVTLTPVGIIIDDAYPRSSVNVALSSVSGSGDDAFVSLKPRYGPNETIGTRHMEVSARLSNVEGIRPTIELLDYASGLINGYQWPSTRRMMWSSDRLNWIYFDITTFSTVNQKITFRHNTPFPTDQVYISRSRQVSVSQFGDFIEALAAAHPTFIEPPDTAVAFTPTLTEWPAQAFIVNEFSTQIDDLDRTIPRVPYYGMVINDTSMMPTYGDKTVILFDLGMHAGEDLGDWAAMRTIENICGNSANALIVRRYFKFYIYGFSNGPGRDGGAYRSGYQKGTGGVIDDGNRHFSDVNPGLESVTIPRAAWLSDLAGQFVSAVIPWHGSYLNSWASFENIAFEASFVQLIETYFGTNLVDEGTQHTGSVGYWGENTLQAPISMTLEFGDLSPKPDSDYVNYASAFVRALSEIFFGELASTDTIGFTENVTLSAVGSIASQATVAFTSTPALGAMVQLASTESIGFSDLATAGGIGSLASVQTVLFANDITLLGNGSLVAQESFAFSYNVTLNFVGDNSITSSDSTTFTTAATLLAFGQLTTQEVTTFTTNASLVGSGTLASTVITAFSDNADLSAVADEGLYSLASLDFSDNVVINATGNMAANDSFGFAYSVTLSEFSVEEILVPQPLSWTAHKLKMRSAVHKAFSVKALYTHPSLEAPEEVYVRYHSRIDRLGDMGSQGYSEILMGIERILFAAEDARRIGVQKGGVITLIPYGDDPATTPARYRLSVREPDDGVHDEIWLVG